MRFEQVKINGVVGYRTIHCDEHDVEDCTEFHEVDKKDLKIQATRARLRAKRKKKLRGK